MKQPDLSTLEKHTGYESWTPNSKVWMSGELPHFQEVQEEKVLQEEKEKVLQEAIQNTCGMINNSKFVQEYRGHSLRNF